MALPGSQRWPRRAVAQVIAFEVAVAEAMPTLRTAIVRANGEPDPEAYVRATPSDAPFALMRAIELAFATDDISRGFKLCRQLVLDPSVRPGTPMQAVQWGTIGALLGLVTVRLGPAGIDYKARSVRSGVRRDGRLFVPWPELGSQMRLLVQRSLPAAVLSGSGEDRFDPLVGEPERRRRAAWTFIATTDEYRIALAADGPIAGLDLAQDLDRREAAPGGDGDGLAALGALERNYQARLDALRATLAWDDLRFRGNLIDWSLVAFYATGLRRRTAWSQAVAQAPAPQAAQDDIGFLQGLAKAMVRLSRRPRGQG